MAPCQSVLFSWQDLGLKRFFGRAEADANLPVLSFTIYAGLIASAVLLLTLCAICLSFVSLRNELAVLTWLSAATLIARQTSVLSKTFQLLELARSRYTAMECGESMLGASAGVAACLCLGMGPVGVFVGMLIGASTILLWDARRIIERLRGGRFDPQLQGRLLGFAAPITVGFLIEYVIASADRLLVELYLGTEAVGIYAVSYSLAERAVSAAFLAVSLMAYPMIMSAHEQGGPAAVHRRAQESCEILLVIALPAWGGFTVASPHIATVLVGPAYAGAAAELLPVTGVAIFLFGLRVHYFNYALHLLSRMQLGLVSSVPAAALNLGLNALLLPRFGLIGAVWASVAAYALALVISIMQAARYYPLPFPFGVAIKAGAATLLMCAALRAMPFPQSPAGLLTMILIGALIYLLLIIAFDIAGIRRIAISRFAHRGL
jgi:O-antigen/teichoic acid export membrane protein